MVLFVGAFFWLLTTHGPLAPVGVQQGSIARADLSPSVFGIGTVDARLAYAVGPIAPGRLLRVLVDQGEAVKAGQLLAEMDPVDLDRRVQAAKSTAARSRQAVQVAEAQAAEAASRARLAAMNRDRDRGLHERHVISKQALDNSTSEAERAEAALVAARANVEAVKQDIERVDAESQGLGSLRESLRLVSPVDGVIVSREAEPGTTVVAGQAVLRVVVPESLWVRARIDQSRAQGVQTGQPASIVLRSTPDTPMPGRVARIEMQSDPVTEERIVNVSFDAPPARLYLGELAEVTIQLPGESGALVVPSAAIAREGSQTGVWQMANGRARFKPVSIGSQAEAGVTQILSGLVEGDSVIVYSSAQLKSGDRVREQKVERR
ncbi:MAG: efflux RND transporter periplasmic adaptor subunit [Deltaproteobacteria bacterium]|nr:efflux RND transporter periplasmic adaptor subunit [Deltaproteobacteria bacterium]